MISRYKLILLAAGTDASGNWFSLLNLVSSQVAGSGHTIGNCWKHPVQAAGGLTAHRLGAGTLLGFMAVIAGGIGRSKV